MQKFIFPTHFRFRSKKEAEHWDKTTKDWIPINEMQIKQDRVEIAAVNFAWVTYYYKKPNLEFSYKPFILCKNCKEEIVEKKGELCEQCYYSSEDEKEE